MCDREEMVVLTKEEYVRLIRAEYKLETMRQYMDMGIHLTDEMLKQFVGIETEYSEKE